MQDIECSNDTSCVVSFSEPNICPMCSHAIQPILLGNRLHYFDGMKGCFSAFFECTHCQKSFIATYDIGYHSKPIGSTHCIATKLLYSAPSCFTKITFDKRITNISPSFEIIYNQALEAEHHNLNEISGIGYRKSLEFLIKDYCAFKNPSDSNKIYKMSLSQCITDYLDDDRIKKSAKVSAWLGNDETHYIRKFEDKDINDLKRFINTAVYFILYNLNVDEADEILNS